MKESEVLHNNWIQSLTNVVNRHITNFYRQSDDGWMVKLCQDDVDFPKDGQYFHLDDQNYSQNLCLIFIEKDQIKPDMFRRLFIITDGTIRRVGFEPVASEVALIKIKEDQMQIHLVPGSDDPGSPEGYGVELDQIESVRCKLNKFSSRNPHETSLTLRR